MRVALAKLDEQWKNQADRVPLRIGIGINHGEMIVGNVGHPDVKMEFTVLGDGVNLAARFESATKQFQNDLLVGESVEALTRAHFIFRRVGLLTVKGKTKPVEAFDVLGERPQADPAWLARYHEAVALFRQRQFEAAGKMFQAVAGEIGQSDFLCQMYGELCATYQQAPPPADWNGAFVLSEK
jgi:adenylate cyclase